MAFQFGFRDVVDILLVALILYETYRLLRRSGVVNVFWGILAFLIVSFLVTDVFELRLTGDIFKQIMSTGVIALIVIFQEEIRDFFYRLGARFSTFKLRRHRNKQETTDKRTQKITQACRHMAQSKTGALIILAGKQDLMEYADTGEYLDATISVRLIENIFFKNTPLHDGALIIKDGRLLSAACILPVSKQQDIPQHYGLRHRAALGLTEKTDATAIVVSEETGHISVARSGKIEQISEEQLYLYLSSALSVVG